VPQTRRRARSRRRSIRLGCSNSLFNAYLSLGNHAFSGGILHSLPCRSPPGYRVVGRHRSRANSSLKLEPGSRSLSVARRETHELLTVPVAVGLDNHQSVFEGPRHANRWVPQYLLQSTLRHSRSDQGDPLIKAKGRKAYVVH
jgi:hypothetical protein